MGCNVLHTEVAEGEHDSSTEQRTPEEAHTTVWLHSLRMQKNTIICNGIVKDQSM